MKRSRNQFKVLTLSLTLLSAVAMAQSADAPSLSEQDQNILSQSALNLAIAQRPELKDLTASSVDPDQLASAQSKLGNVLNAVYSTSNATDRSFHASGVDHTSAKDVRLTSWNISYGQDLPTILDLFDNTKGQAINCGSPTTELEKEKCALRDSDILVLNEADKGLCRSGYADVPAELAKALRMDSIFNAEYFEAESFYHGGTLYPDSKNIVKACARAPWGNDHSSLTGTAILSRFPILNSRPIRLPVGYMNKNGTIGTKEKHQTVCADVLNDTAKEPTLVDKGVKFAAEHVFDDDGLSRQLRYGSRNALVADIQLPDNKVVTVVAMHLEVHSKESCRRAEMAYVFREMKDNKNPIVYAGDLNTTGEDGGSRNTAVTLGKIVLAQTVESPFFIADMAGYAAPTGVSQGFTAGKAAITFLTTHRNPTRKNIPYFRPSKDGPFFDLVKKNGILWKGDASASLNGKDNGPWSQTNERAKIGFKGTEYLNKTYGPIGESKLDWIFFKPDSNKDIMPKFPRTLEEIRNSMGKKDFPSDHVPVSVLLEAK